MAGRWGGTDYERQARANESTKQNMDAVEINSSDPPQNKVGAEAAVEICRVCLLSNIVMRDLFLESEVASLSVKAMSFANVKILPGDGLPAQVCEICADKLESAYELKLQVEQADVELRERFDAINIKEELFFNEVEVHLDASDRNEVIGEMRADIHYVPNDESSVTIHENEETLLKDQLAILHVEKLPTSEQDDKEHDEVAAIASDQSQEATIPPEGESMGSLMGESKNVMALNSENVNQHCTNDAIPAEEHDYILHQGSIMSNEERCVNSERSYSQQDNITEECIEMFAGADTKDELKVNAKNETMLDADAEGSVSDADGENREEDSMYTKASAPATPISDDASYSQNETRRSKRKLARRAIDATDRNSDEEIYFENLNLSSRLKKARSSENSEKVLFACYICDEQFISKNVLKEHMHSHVEVRRTLTLNQSSERSRKIHQSPVKTPQTGKKMNKCPYCGKEYLYIVSYNKHLKRHEREQDDVKAESISMEISFHEDDHSLDFDDLEDSEDLGSEYRSTGKEEGKKRERTGSTMMSTPIARPKEENEEVDENEEMNATTDAEADSELLDEKSGEVVSKKERQKKRSKCLERPHTRRGLRKYTSTQIDLKCNVCEEEFDSLEKLRNHRARHVVEGVLTEQDLEEHMVKKEMTDTYGQRREEGEEEDVKTEFTECALRRNGRNADLGYGCKKCRQRFPRKDQLLRHLEQHGGVNSYRCTECNKTFGNELTLRNHLIGTNHKTFVHGEEYDPNKRLKRVAARAAQKIIDKITTEDGMEDASEEGEEEEEEEEESQDRTRSDGERGRARRGGVSPSKSSNRKGLECGKCNKKCISKQSLAKHMGQHHSDDKPIKVEKTVKGDTMKNISVKQEHPPGFGNDDDLDFDSDFESGLDWPMDTHECTTCKKTYSTKKSLLRHQLLHEEPNFECDICNVKFYRKDKLKAHYDKCSEKNPDQVRKCNICGDSFENNEILREHRSKHVTEGILTEEDLRDIEPRPEEKKEGEKIGRKRRDDIVGLECTECNKQYTSRKGLLRHIQVHEDKKYLCDMCPKKFYRREHLKIHVAKHNMIKPYKCTRCSKHFIKEEQLNNHLTKHDRTFKKSKETDSSKRFLCEICSKSFTQSTTLIAHLRAHNGIKPYVCEVCSRPFTTNAYLKMHMRTHTQERPYICQYCSRAFARADTLANHLTSHTGEAKYHCKYCPKNFRRLKSLKEHVFIHTGQRPYACPTCDRRFNNNGSRYAHSKRCKQNFVQNHYRAQTSTQLQPPQNQQRVLHHASLSQAQVVKAQNIKTITIARQSVGTDSVTAQQVMQHQEILMPLILPLTVTLADVGEEVILPEGTKIFTTS